MSTRLPIARFMSTRCRPHCASVWPLALRSPGISSTRDPALSPCTVTSRYVAFSFDAHRAVSNPGRLTQGVSIFRPSATHGFSAAVPVIVRPSVERYARNSPLPPESEAGLVQAAVKFSPATLPNSVFAGGGAVDRKEEKLITHPVCDPDRHSGTCSKAPPTSLPRGTASVAPARIAEI